MEFLGKRGGGGVLDPINNFGHIFCALRVKEFLFKL